MRIVAGKYGSRRLKGPGKLELRPTSDRLRETLFNILGTSVEHSRFIDVYAGTGAVGVEALSRGASRAIFLEIARGALSLIRQNLEAMHPEGNAEVLPGEALRSLSRLKARGEHADFIFLDPPYDDETEYQRVLEFLGHSAPLSPQGIIIVEHRSTLTLPEAIGKLECWRRVRQGDARLSFYLLSPGV